MEKEQWELLLLEHNRRYGLWQIQDAIKLLFQSLLGGGHLVSDPEQNLRYFLWEWYKQTSDSSHILIESLGSENCRIYLPAYKGRCNDPHRLHKVFLESAQDYKARPQELALALRVLENLVSQGELPFDREEAKTVIADFETKGFPLISHSQKYHAHYKPSYRVISKKLIKELF